jgi:hypothetical protein
MIVLSVSDQDAPFHFHRFSPALMFDNLCIDEVTHQDPNGLFALSFFPPAKMCG